MNKIITTQWDQKDHFYYKNHVTMQSPVAFEVFDEFFKYNKFDTILEIGTAGGGWSIFLKDHADKMEATFKTYDIRPFPTKGVEFSGIDFALGDVFDNIDDVKNRIINGGRVALFCDGGNKIREYNTLASSMKLGDFILAHDYSPNYEIFLAEMNNKWWNWCEIMDEHVKDAMIANNIVKYNPAYFLKSAWLCTEKM